MSADSKEPQLYVFQETALRLGIENFKKAWSQGTPEFIAQRAKARGLSEHDYMAGNLLGREVTADDVAQAFLHQALELKTTGDVTTVDGGNIAAALR